MILLLLFILIFEYLSYISIININTTFFSYIKFYTVYYKISSIFRDFNLNHHQFISSVYRKRYLRWTHIGDRVKPINCISWSWNGAINKHIAWIYFIISGEKLISYANDHQTIFVYIIERYIRDLFNSFPMINIRDISNQFFYEF